MGFEPNLLNPSRYSRSFNVLTPNAFFSPFFFMAASTTGVAGQVVKYTANENEIAIAGSGVLVHQIAGILLQDVRDLDSGPVKGYRNLQQTVVNLGDNVGVLQGSNNVALTKAYTGSPALGDRLCVAANGYVRKYGGALETGDPIAVVEAVTSAATPTVEPAQLSSGGVSPDWIRIRTYNL